MPAGRLRPWGMRPILRALARIAAYLLAFAALPVAVGVAGFRSSMAHYLAPAPDGRLPPSAWPAPPPLDPGKPTVVVVLGKDVTEVADALAPYATFAAAGAFNVVMAAEERRPVALTGGLDVLPHHTLAELEAGRPPELIIVPNIADLPANEAVRQWVGRQGRAGSLVMSVCAGAQMLAATGLLDGQRATTHWSAVAGTEKQFPRVQWVRGQRYVDNGRTISTAGILSGIDGSLHMIDRLRGRAQALAVAEELHYPARAFLDDPSMEQLQFGPRDGVVLLNAAYLWDSPTLGVALQDGVDELALAAVFDTYALAHPLYSVAPRDAIVTARRGLQVVARRAPEEWPAGRELLLPGSQAPKATAWLARFSVTPTLPNDERFPFGPALEDLARRHDLPTATFGARRLEYRLPLALPSSRGWLTMAVVWRPLLLGFALVALLWWFRGRRHRRRRV
jgi:putative intracellular protease/amidase